MFPLLRYFSIASLISMIVTTALLGTLNHKIEKEQLIDIGQNNHDALTQAVANALLPQFRHLVESAEGLDSDTLRLHPEVIALRPQVLNVLKNTRVIKLKFYDLNGRTVYSTDLSQIGKDYSQNPGFISAAQGQTLSELTHRKTFSATDGELENLDVISSYVAMRANKTAPIEGVMEVYSEVTDWVARTEMQARIVTLATILAFSFLYSVLYVIVRRADRMIRNQYEQLNKSELELRIAAIAFENQLGMVITDTEGVIQRVNQSFSAATDYSADEVIGQTLRILKSDRHDDLFYATMWRAIRENGAWQGEIWHRRKNGEVHPDWLTIKAVYEETGEVTHYVATLTDITQRKESEERITFLAFNDPLTGLPNRRLLNNRLVHALATSARSGRHGALMFIDLDHFKSINDSLGHGVGDLLLHEVANRLKNIIRKSDTAARLGGDEFMVMLEYLEPNFDKARVEAEMIGEKIRVELAKPYVFGEKQCVSTPSIGIVLFNGDKEDFDTLVKKADHAMYHAKSTGRNSVSFFQPEKSD